MATKKSTATKARARKPRPGIRVIEVMVYDAVTTPGFAIGRGTFAVRVSDVDAMPPVVQCVVGPGYVEPPPRKAPRRTSR